MTLSQETSHPETHHDGMLLECKVKVPLYPERKASVRLNVTCKVGQVVLKRVWASISETNVLSTILVLEEFKTMVVYITFLEQTFVHKKLGTMVNKVGTRVDNVFKDIALFILNSLR